MQLGQIARARGIFFTEMEAGESLRDASSRNQHFERLTRGLTRCSVSPSLELRLQQAFQRATEADHRKHGRLGGEMVTSQQRADPTPTV
jgi:hypothetical protein